MFVTFEGTEGSGKSTVIKGVVACLRRIRPRLKTLATREPGGPKVSEKIREILLKFPMDPWTEVLLYEASRAEHVAVTVLPALRAGRLVLCDRYTDSTLAYQGAARGLPLKPLKLLNQIATHGLKPDLTVWLDLPVRIGLERASQITRFEREGAKFQARVRSGFARLARAEPRRWLRLDSSKHSPTELTDIVVKEILRRLKA